MNYTFLAKTVNGGLEKANVVDLNPWLPRTVRVWVILTVEAEDSGVGAQLEDVIYLAWGSLTWPSQSEPLDMTAKGRPGEQRALKEIKSPCLLVVIECRLMK